jgi:acetyl esterase/lipase
MGFRVQLLNNHTISQDLMLHEIQQKTNLAVISIDYRLAPEHPWPAALDDCIDVAEWLLENSQSQVFFLLAWGV